MNIASTMPLILFCMFLNTAAQLLLKATMNQAGKFAFVWNSIIPIGLKIIFCPYFIAGLFCYVFSMFVWLMILSRVDVGVAYPLNSIAFILTAICAYFFFGESLSFIRIAGIFVIIFGIYLVTRS